MKTKIQQFLCVYMYELENYLSTQKKEIQKISLWQDEANTDRPLKEYLKKLIEGSFDQIPDKTQISHLVIGKGVKVNVSELQELVISRVLLPEEVTPEVKDVLMTNKTNSYTSPDLCLEIQLGGQLFYESIELKTTKKDSIPGSSVQQVTPNEWVIFVKFSKNTVEVTTGQYINAINSSMQFPDRSPRPQVAFSEMLSWNLANRVVSAGQLIFKEDEDGLLKYELLSDWQDVLAKRWVDILLDATTTKKNEPWFNNALRKFIIEFLATYDELSQDEQTLLKEKISSLIE